MRKRTRGPQRLPFAMAMVIVSVGAVSTYGAGAKFTGEEWLGQWWSWQHWWETTRQEFVREPQVHMQAALVDSAVKTCLDATQDDDEKIRAAAAIALGKIGDLKSESRLCELTEDSSPQVKEAAWIGLGLTSGPQAHRHFAMAPPSDEATKAAYLMGIGLLDRADDSLLKKVLEALHGTKDARTRRWALWTLRIQRPADAHALMRQVVVASNDALLVNEALLGLGAYADENDAKILVDVYSNSVLQRTVVPALNIRNSQYQPTLKSIVVKYGHDVCSLRTSAAISFRNVYLTGSPRAQLTVRRALRRTYKYVDAREGRRTYRVDTTWHGAWTAVSLGGYEVRFGLPSLGEFGDESDAEILTAVMLGRHTIWRSTGGTEFDPGRGFAAIGLGLYLRRGSREDGEGHDVAKRGKRQRRHVVNKLIWIAQGKNEPSDLRAACLLALGLSNEPVHGDRIVEAVSGNQDPLLLGYATAALGMLQDQRAVSLARRTIAPFGGTPSANPFYKRGFDRHASPRDIVAIRAAIFGLGCLQRKDLVPALSQLYGTDPWITSEVIDGLRRCGGTEVADHLVKEMTSQQDGRVKAIVLWCLGNLLDHGNGIRMRKRLLNSVNVTACSTDPIADDLHRYANEFLFSKVIGNLRNQ